MLTVMYRKGPGDNIIIIRDYFWRINGEGTFALLTLYDFNFLMVSMYTFRIHKKVGENQYKLIRGCLPILLGTSSYKNATYLLL